MSDLRERLLMKLSKQLGPATSFRIAWRSLQAVIELHQPFPIFGKCGHDHTADEPGVLDIDDVGLTCEAGRLYNLCEHCHTTDGQAEDFDAADWPCPTLRRIAKEILGEE